MKMQRLHLLAMEEERQSLMDALLQFGRLEIRQTEDLAADPDWAVLLHPEPAELVRWREASRQMEAALSALGSRGLKKAGLFAPRPRISQSQFLDEAALRQQQALAAEILGHTARKEQLTSQLQRIQAQRLSLEPWAELDVPLELHRSGQLSVIPGTMPLRSDLQQAKNALEEQPAELVQVSLSPQQQYLLLLVHQAAESAVLEVLRPFGFAAASFGTLTGTVQENLQRLDDEEEQTRQDRRAEDAALDALGGRQPELKLGLDRLNLQIQREENRQRLLTDGHIFYLEGWVPEADTARLVQLAVKNGAGTEEIILSPEDAPLGQQVLEGANAQGRHFRLSAEQRPTGGGLILKQGSVECSCTFPEILRQLRQEMSGEVAAILFD